MIFGGTRIALPEKFAGLDFVSHAHGFKGLALGQHRAAAMPWGFTFTLDLNHAERPCEASFDARMYAPAKVRDFLQSYVHLLDQLSAAPGQSMDRLVSAAAK